MIPDMLTRYRTLRALLALITVILTIFTIQLIWSSLVTFGDIILLFLLAWVIAFILEPLSVSLRQRGIPRAVSVSLIYGALAIVLTGVIVLTIPIIGVEIRRLATELTAAVSPDNLDALERNAIVLVERMGIRPQDATRIVPQVWGQIPSYTNALTGQGLAIGTNAIASVLTLLFDAFLVSILSFYMMLDGERIIGGIVRRLPPAWRPDARMFQNYVSQMFGGFLRAQLILSLIYAIFTWTMLALLGQANGLLVALICGLLVILPFIGPIIAVIPPFALVLLQTPSNDLAAKLLILVIGLIVAQQITFQVIAPRVFSSHMGISPLLLFAALLVGAKEGGVWGAFFAGPIVAVAYAMLEVFYQRFRRTSPLYAEEDEAGVEGETTTATEGGATAVAPATLERSERLPVE